MVNSNKSQVKQALIPDRKVSIDFTDPRTPHDRVLIIDGITYYVNSMLLSMCSEFFKCLFNSDFQEKNQLEIHLKEVSSEDFADFLSILYPQEFKITKENVGGLLILADRFLAPVVWQKCIEFVDEPKNEITFEVILEWSKFIVADSYKARVLHRVNELLLNLKTKEGIVYVLDKCKGFTFLDIKKTAESALLKIFQSEFEKMKMVGKYVRIAVEHHLDALKENVVQWLVKTIQGASTIFLFEILPVSVSLDLRGLTEEIDERLAQVFEKDFNFDFLEQVVRYNLNSTKASMERYLQLGTLKDLKKKQGQLSGPIKMCSKVAKFIRRGMARNENNELLLKYFFESG